MAEVESKQQYKVGRTLLVKPNSEHFDSSVLSGLEGVSNSFESEKTNTFFLTFSETSSAETALETLRERDDCRVKCAHYRVFFKVSGLDKDSDYNTVKSEHSSWVEEHSGAQVLFYKLYRNRETGEYLGSGDFVVDTKESFDRLLDRSDEGSHKYDTETVSCRHYRYNRKPMKQGEHVNANA